MKAMVYHEYGLPDVLRLEEVAKPAPGDNEVLIKVVAASINDWDWQLLQGIPFANRVMAGLFRPKKIKILGSDIAGRIEAAGKNAKRFRPGDEVFGDLSGAGFGGFAEYVCAPEDALTLKPVGMTFEQAAAVPQAGLLALQGLVKGHVQQAHTVLINGASGGAGSFAVQIAKSVGAEVTGVCRTQKLDFVRSLGADHVIDYTREDFTRNGQTYDLILDMEAYHSVFDYRRALNAGGRYVAAGGPTANIVQVIFLGAWISLTSSKKMGLLLLKANRGLSEIIKLIENGEVKPVIDKCFPLGEAPDAMRYFGEGRKMGKVVITLE
jgi:NADPH:quinone reductase-like Zn-dependent oxidoreductase